MLLVEPKMGSYGISFYIFYKIIMKKFSLLFFLLCIVFPVFADVKFGELIQKSDDKNSSYYPFSYNQYGVDTGIFQFPDDVKILINEKSKRVYHKPEYLPDVEDLQKYHLREPLYWYWEKYPPETYRFEKVEKEDRGMPGRSVRLIPQRDNIIETMIEKV